MTEPRIRYDILANAQGEDDVRRLAAELSKLDEAVDPAAADRAKALGDRLRELGDQQAAIRAFADLKKETGETRQRLDEAQTAAQKLGQELAQTEKPTRAQVGQFEKLRDAVKAGEAELQTKTRALEGARGKLGELGISTDGLASKERELRTATADVRGEIAQLGQQGQAVQRFNELAQATEKARLELNQADKAVEAYRQELTAAGEPTTAQTRKLGELEKSANGAQQAFQSASQSQAQAASSLRAAGVDVDRLNTAQGKLAPTQRQVAEATQDATTALQANAGALGTVGDASTGAAAQLGNAKVQIVAAGAALVGLQQVLGGAAKASSEFSTAMAEVSTIVDDATDIDALARSVEQLTLKFGGSAPDQARALYQIISAGATDAAQAVQLLEAANELAIGGVTDVKTAAEGLVGALNAYGTEAGTAKDVSDALFVAMRAGRTTVGELSSNIGQVAPIAKQAGVSLDELLSGAAALTTVSGNTSQAMTQLRAIINGVIKPSGEAAKLAKELGLEFNATALQSQGLAGFLEQVRTAAGGNTETIAKLFGSVEALGGVLALTGEQNGIFTQTLQNMSTRAGATEAAFAKLAETPAQAAARFGAALEQLQRTLGSAVTSFTPLLEGTTKALNLFNELPGPIRTGTVAVGALAVSLPALGIALAGTSAALAAVRTAFVGKAAAATATVAPLAAAAAGTRAMGVASAAATPAITGAAVATTALSRALTLLRAATGIGLVVGLAQLATSFISARREAEALKKATQEALAAPPEQTLPKAAADAAAAIRRTADSAAAARDALREQDVAARDAAKALGVDLYKASNLINDDFAKQLDQLAKLVGGLKSLKQSGVDTGQAVQAALEKMIGGARNQAELDTLKTRIEALGKAGEISKGQVDALMKALQDQAKAATGEVDKLAEAYKRLGVATAAEMAKIAEDNRKAWVLIRDDATASIETKRQAFEKYAQSAIKANGGVADSALTSQAQAMGMTLEFDKAGKAISISMAGAKQATDNVGQAASNAGRQMGEAAAQADRLRQAAQGASTAFGVLQQQTTGNAFGLNQNQETTAERNARVDRDLPTIDSFGNLIRNTASGDITRTVGAGQAVNKPTKGDWTYVISGYDVRGVDARGNAVPGGWKSTGGLVDPRAVTQPGSGFGMTTNPRWNADGTVSGGGASPAGTSTGSSSSTSAEARRMNGEAEAALMLTAALARLKDVSQPATGGALASNASIQPPPVQMNVYIGGQLYSIGAATQAAAENTIRAIEAAFKAGGG